MAERWITVATFATPEQAHIVCNALRETGLPAQVTDDVVVGFAWHLGTALGGVKVKVPEEHVAAAREFLGYADDEEEDVPYGDDSPPDEELSPDDDPAQDEADDPHAPTAAQLTDRAFKAAVIGLVFCQGFLQVYSIWNLLKAAAIEDPDDGRSNWKWYAALLLNFAAIGFVVLVYRLFTALGARDAGI
jgi:hypothetical protein